MKSGERKPKTRDERGQTGASGTVENRGFRERCAAFSLLEMIGVLAVAAIIALAFALTTTKSLDRAFSASEQTVMQNLANALQSSVLRNAYIPGTNDMAQVIATELGIDLTMVQNNDRGVARKFLVDPAFQINYTNCQSGYVQTVDGAYQTFNPYRIMILSSISPAAPLPTITVSVANFSNIWNTADSNIPTTSPDFASYAGQAGDVIIQRINLSSLFVNLQLSKDSSSGAEYLIQGQPTLPLTLGQYGVNSSYIQNSLLTLINASGSPTVTNAELMLNRSLSFFFVQNFWRSVPFAPASVSAAQTNAAAGDLATAIAITAGIFANSPFNTNATSTPPQVLNSMSNFMAAYVPYANWVVNSNGGTWAAPAQTDPNYGIYTNAKSYQTLMAAAMVNLANPGSANGNVSQYGCTNGPSQ